MFIVSTCTSFGSFAICNTVSATCWGSKVASGRMLPSGCIAPSANGLAKSVRAFPMSICVQLILYALPSNEVHLVSPRTACFDAVYAKAWTRGTCADTDPLFMMRPPGGDWDLKLLKAALVQRKMPVTLTSCTLRKVSKLNSSTGVAGAPIPAFYDVLSYMVTVRVMISHWRAYQDARRWISSPWKAYQRLLP